MNEKTVDLNRETDTIIQWTGLTTDWRCKELLNLKINLQKLSNLKWREKKLEIWGVGRGVDLRDLWDNKSNIHIIGALEGKKSK